MDLTRAIHERARDDGCIGFGVCDAAPFPDVRESLEERAASGTSGGVRLTYTDPAVATDVSQSFPWARRLAVAARAYLPAAGSPGAAAPGTGRVARFATEDHYEELRLTLGAIAEMLRDAGHRAGVLVDDNRLVDRAAAVRAGVAWWGKSTMALVPGAGPWVLLGAVATDADLEPSAPMKRDCGTCVACLPACPTGALVAPGVLDARLCISHWLQAPGVIPREMRPAIGDRIYGCDDCLDACPPGWPLLQTASRAGGRHDLVALLSLDDGSLVERFRHFYVPRRHARYLRRNVVVALGNSGGRDAFEVLAGYCGHPDWLLRAHAVWALAALDAGDGAAVLAEAATGERRPEVIEELRAAGVRGIHDG